MVDYRGKSAHAVGWSATMVYLLGECNNYKKGEAFTVVVLIFHEYLWQC